MERRNPRHPTYRTPVVLWHQLLSEKQRKPLWVWLSQVTPGGMAYCHRLLWYIWPPHLHHHFNVTTINAFLSSIPTRECFSACWRKSERIGIRSSLLDASAPETPHPLSLSLEYTFHAGPNRAMMTEASFREHCGVETIWNEYMIELIEASR